MIGAMRFVVLLALAGCIEGEPDPTEMVVYGIADRGDVIISGGMIRWTDGMSAREAPLTAIPISSRETIPLADTTHHITVHGDTVYVVDSTGIVSFTGGAMARVVTQPDVSRVIVPDDNELYWTDTTGLSFFGAGGQQKSVYVDADAVLDLVATGGELYATTAGYYSVPPLGALVYRSKLIRVDKSAASATVLSDASDFAGDFIDDGHFDGVLHVETVADGYAYGYVPAIGGVGLDLRRIAL
jgi:hypothetical protein